MRAKPLRWTLNFDQREHVSHEQAGGLGDVAWNTREVREDAVTEEDEMTGTVALEAAWDEEEMTPGEIVSVVLAAVFSGEATDA